MATTIKLKNSVTTTNAPSSLVQGEVAINVTDKKVWVGNAATTPVQLLGTGADGSFTNISVSGVASFADGTVSLPAITNTGDTNTGIFFPAADTIAFTEGGVESMRIDSSGNLGIGTTTSSAGGLLTLNRAPTASFGSPILQVGGSSFTSGGYYSVGLGFTDATYTEPPAEIAYVSTSDSGGTKGAIVFGNRDVTTNTAVTERMRIDSSGNLLFNSGYGSVATAYGCRAWVNFNGTGTVTIRASGNVSSITDNNTGDYTVNFTTAMPDANYACLGFGEAGGGSGNKGPYQATSSSSGARVFVYNSGGSLVDSALMNIAIFR